MPGFDGTGPMGQGPMTGGARGFCNPRAADYGLQFAGGFGFGRGFGGGLGRGQGFRRGFGRGMGRGYGQEYFQSYQSAPADETAMLRSETDYSKRSLEAISKRLEELEKKNL